MKQSSQSPIRSSIYIGVMLILLLMLLITLGGCGHDEEPATPKKPRGSTPGVSSVQYEQQALFNPLALTIKPDAVPEPKPTAPMPDISSWTGNAVRSRHRAKQFVRASAC